jgi:hypothetical protein
MQQLTQLAEFITCLATARLVSRSTVTGLLPRGFIAALLDRLVLIKDRATFSPPDGSAAAEQLPATADGAAKSSGTGPSVHSISLLDLCSVLWQCLEMITVTLPVFISDGQLQGGADASILQPMEQLLSSPAALQALLQLGLSDPVLEAARQGASEAIDCVASLCYLFRNIAFTLRVQVLTQRATRRSDKQLEEAVEKLAAFLGLEENLPYLEPLCLPPDHSEPHRSALKLEPVASRPSCEPHCNALKLNPVAVGKLLGQQRAPPQCLKVGTCCRLTTLSRTHHALSNSTPAPASCGSG